jgi:hypothetical protein
MWGALSDERTGLSFTISAGPRQGSHSRVRVPRDSWSYFTVSDSRLPQHGEPGSRIYTPQEQGGPVIPPGTGFLFVSYLSGLRWRYSNPPPHGGLEKLNFFDIIYTNSVRTSQEPHYVTELSSIYLSLRLQNVECYWISAMLKLICVRHVLFQVLLLILTSEGCNVFRIT